MLFGNLMHYKRYNMILLLTLTTVAISIAIFNYIIDPFWIWREKRILSYNDTLLYVNLMHQRQIKPIAAFMLNPQNVIIGSSRVYHVFDINNIRGTEVWYNMGISSLKMSEALVYIQGLIKYTNVKHIYFALDVFSIADPTTLEGFEEHAGDRSFPVYGIISSLIGADVTRDSIDILFNKHDGYSRARGAGKNYFMGKLFKNGYEYTPKRPGEVVLLSQKKEQRIGSDFEGIDTKKAVDIRLAKLKEIILLTKKNHVELTLFFSPISNALEFWYQSSPYKIFNEEWKSQVIQIAKEQHITLYDFLAPNIVSNSPFFTADEVNNNLYFIDFNHATALVGNYILTCFGVPLNNKVTPPDHFCQRAN